MPTGAEEFTPQPLMPPCANAYAGQAAAAAQEGGAQARTLYDREVPTESYAETPGSQGVWSVGCWPGVHAWYGAPWRSNTEPDPPSSWMVGAPKLVEDPRSRERSEEADPAEKVATVAVADPAEDRLLLLLDVEAGARVFLKTRFGSTSEGFEVQMPSSAAAAAAAGGWSRSVGSQRGWVRVPGFNGAQQG